MKALTSLMLVYSVGEVVVWASPLIVSVVSLADYSVGFEEPLTTAKVFTALALFNALRSPLQDLPCAIQACLQANVALQRMEDYIHDTELDSFNVFREDLSQTHGVVIDVQNGRFGWKTDTSALTNVNIQAKRGDLVVIHGAVGVGKCVCLSVNKWLTTHNSRGFRICPSVIILFGEQFDDEKYRKALNACCLVLDMKQFPSGDLSDIGQKGVNLSGGQKARIALARACYADTDVYILDSPLAAVDSIVQNEIISECMCGLLTDKTVVLVTHNVDIIRSPAVNCIITLKNGTVHSERYVPELHRSTYAKWKLMNVPKTAGTSKESTSSGRFVEEEWRQEGRVKSEVFWTYFNALGGARMCALIIVSQLLWQGFQIGSDFWLSHWTNEAQVASTDHTQRNMEIYALLGGGGALMILVRSVRVDFVGLRGAQYLFRAMTEALLYDPMRFFDANPTGRIVNRYTTDMGSIDFQLPLICGAFIADFFMTICQLATAAYMVNYLGLLVLPLGWIYVKVANFYLASSSEISRLQRVASSPVLSYVKQCEKGLEIIRSFGPNCISRITNEMVDLIDQRNKVSYIQIAAEMWYVVRIQFIGCGVVIGIVSSLVYLRSFLSPGLAGLAFLYVLNVDSGLSNIVRQWSFGELIEIAPLLWWNQLLIRLVAETLCLIA